MHRDTLVLLVVGTAVLAVLLVGAALVATPAGADESAPGDRAGPGAASVGPVPAIGAAATSSAYSSKGNSGSYPTASTTAESVSSTFSPVSTLM